MKKVLSICCGLFVVLLLAVPTQASSWNCNIQQTYFSSTDFMILGPGDSNSITDNLAYRIIDLAAPQLGLSFTEAVELYDSGDLAIIRLDKGLYMVDGGTGNIAIVVLDSL